MDYPIQNARRNLYTLLIENARICFLLAALFLIAIYLLPYVLLRGESHILVHDNLDGNIVRYKILIDSGHVFSSNETIIEPLMGGLPRSRTGCKKPGQAYQKRYRRSTGVHVI